MMRVRCTTFLLAAAMVCLLVLQSCNRANEVSLSDDDAVDEITSYLAYKDGGITDEMDQVNNYTNTHHKKLTCGESFDTTISISRTGLWAYTYTHNWKGTLNCVNDVPSTLTWTGSYSGSFNVPSLMGDGSGTRSWVLAGLEPNAQFYLLNGNTSRTGTRTSKLRNKVSYSVTTTSTITDWAVNKITGFVKSGQGTFSTTFIVIDGETKTFSGSFVVNGDGTSTITLNGKTYVVKMYE